jgi:hypothetical protein
MSMNPAFAYDWILTGLAFDFFGGMVLAKGLVQKTVKEAYREAQARFGVNSFVVRSSIFQKGEAVVGAVLLSAGYALQLVGNFHGGPAANDLGWIDSLRRLALVMSAVGTISCALLWAAHRWANRRFWIYFTRNFRIDAQLLTQTGSELDALGYLYSMKRQSQESDQGYRDRLEIRRLRIGARYGGRGRDMGT